MPFERFETGYDGDPGAGDPEAALEGVIQELEKRGIGATNLDPEVCMVIRTNLPQPDGYRNISIIAYIGATPQEVAADLTTRQ